MGGLDARYMIAKLGMDDAGAVADDDRHAAPRHRVRRLGRAAFWPRCSRRSCGLLGIPYQAFYRPDDRRCRRFNEDVPDVPGVRYFSVAGRVRAARGSGRSGWSRTAS